MPCTARAFLASFVEVETIRGCVSPPSLVGRPARVGEEGKKLLLLLRGLFAEASPPPSSPS